MKPYYEDDAVTIYHGDALHVLESIDRCDIHAVVTDPPYASGARTEAAKSSSGAMLRGSGWDDKPIVNDQMTTGGFVWLMRHTALALYPWMVPGASWLSFIDWRQWPNLAGALETVNLRIQQMVVWDKGNPGMGNGFRSQHELILHAAKGVPNIHSPKYGNVFAARRERPVDHPSPKPLGLMEKLIEVVTAPGEVVVDPYMGSGTTLLAAQHSGRRSIGIEAEEALLRGRRPPLRSGHLRLRKGSMSNPVHGVNLRPFALICEAHQNAVSAKAVQQCPDCYRLLADARDRHPLMRLDADTGEVSPSQKGEK